MAGPYYTGNTSDYGSGGTITPRLKVPAIMFARNQCAIAMEEANNKLLEDYNKCIASGRRQGFCWFDLKDAQKKLVKDFQACNQMP